MEEFIGIIKIFAGNFAPRGWAFCQGQLLSIAQNTSLFSIIGTTYGGDGRTTFALPDLRGHTPIGFGPAKSGTSYDIGEQGGAETIKLTESQLAVHSHTANGTIKASANPGSTNSPESNYPALSRTEVNREPYSTNSYKDSADTNMAQDAVSIEIENAGDNQPHSNMQPFLAMNYIICLVGVFPPRD